MISKVEYLSEQIKQHIKRFFHLENDNLINEYIIFKSFVNCCRTKKECIAIPIDIASSSELSDIYKVTFNGTQITLWHRLEKPIGWEAIPNDLLPIWYKNKYHTIMPAWNLFENLFNLLTFSEEISSNKRDEHKRFIASYSPRLSESLLEVPAFNEACALLVAAAIGLSKNNTPDYTLSGVLKPVVAILSHDNDILLGNDKWTQAIRLYRCVEPLLHFRLPLIKNLVYMIQNYYNPRRYYWDDIPGMIDLERMHNATSSFYFINGSGGRFGARSGKKIIPEALHLIPERWNVGMHYNYDTFLNDILFCQQKAELENIIKRKIVSGRAHYLRFDPVKSLPFLDKMGILFDESAGYPDKIGYRCGIAGPFNPYNTETSEQLKILEYPLVIMDGTLVDQYPDNPAAIVEKMLQHLSKIGGALPILFHPGTLKNPETPKTYKLYFDILKIITNNEMKATDCTLMS